MHLRSETRTATAGALATAVTYGPARMGFGLFLPEFRQVFDFSLQTAGFIAAGAYAGFLLTLVLAGAFTVRCGPRLPIVAGTLIAALGMGIIAAAQSVGMLALGVVTAGSSAGFAWVPFNNAAKQAVPEHLEGRVLSVVSTGTTFGVAAAAGLAVAVLVHGSDWRVTWAAFALVAAAVAAINIFALSGLTGRCDSSQAGETRRWRDLWTVQALPLIGVALSFGASSSFYMSFAVDRLVSAGGLPGVLPQATGPVLFACFGLAGAAGLFTGEVEHRLGLSRLVRSIFICSAVSLGLLWPVAGSWPVVGVSAALQGICVMSASAVLAFWSLRVYPFLPAVSFTAVLLFLAAGNICGPALGGLAAGRIGMPATFGAFAALSLLTALALPRRLLDRT